MTTRLLWTIAAASFCLFAWKAEVASAGSGNPLTADILWQIERLGKPDLSPDGSWAVVPVTTFDVSEDKGTTDLWLVPSKQGEARRLTTHQGDDSSPVWSPDGQWIAFESRRGDDDANQIYVIPTTGGEAVRVTNVPTGASAPSWFPDSQRIAFISRVWTDIDTWEEMAARLKEREESKVSAKVWDQAPLSHWDRWLDDREAHIYTIPLEDGDPTPVTTGTGLQLSRTSPGRDSYDISPDGEELAFAADIDTTGVETNYDIFVVPAKGGEARNISSENLGNDVAPQYAPNGRWIAFQRQTIRGFYADTRRLVLHDRGTGDNAVVTMSWDRSVRSLVFTPDSRSAFAAIDDAGTNRVYRIELPSGKPTRLTGESDYSSLALSRDGRIMVALRQSFVEPPTLVSITARTGATSQLSRFNDELLADVTFGRFESVTYKGANDQEIQMWVVYPPDFDAEKEWPLYLLLHGGPHNGVTNSFHWRWNAQVFSGWGYVTAWHNFHGSSGFGQAFTDSINPAQSELPYIDTIEAAEYFKEKPWIDGERMAAGGGSYGGYLASILLGREHPFQTLVAHAAVYNWYTQYAADYGASKRRFGEFWETPGHYRLSSPHYGAGNFNTPTLVIHGQLDYRVPVTHGIELFNTLQNRGVRSRFIYYPDENHWILKPNNSIHWYAEKEAWLAEFIGAAED